jgi:hypothetical protein
MNTVLNVGLDAEFVGDPAASSEAFPTVDKDQVIAGITRTPRHPSSVSIPGRRRPWKQCDGGGREPLSAGQPTRCPAGWRAQREAGPGSPIGAVTVPPWQEGAGASVLPRSYQDLVVSVTPVSGQAVPDSKRHLSRTDRG